MPKDNVKIDAPECFRDFVAEEMNKPLDLNEPHTELVRGKAGLY
jgi:hypothetical protein